jgi:hypothetical protein
VVRNYRGGLHHMSVKEFLKQQAVNIAVGGQYTLSNWFDAQGKPRTFACRTSRGFGTRVISHPLIFRCVRNSDSETTRKNNLLYGTSSCGRRPPSPREWGGGHEKRKSPGAFGLQEFYVDGFGNFHLSNGILRCAAFTQQQAPGGRTQSIAVFRLIIQAVGTRTSIEAAARALGNNIATLHVLK